MRPLDFQDFITNKGYVATPNFTKMRKALHKGIVTLIWTGAPGECRQKWQNENIS